MATEVRTDQRSRVVERAPRAEQAAREALREIARAETKAAKALASIESRRSYVGGGFASVHAWAEAEGFGPRQVARLLALGRSLLQAPELVAQVSAGEVPAESAVSIGRVIAEPALRLSVAEREEWVRKARTLPPRVLRAEAERAVEEARQGEPTYPMRFMVTSRTRDGFHRARLLMSRGEPRWITEGETFGRLVKDWLGQNDPALRPLPKRPRGSAKPARSRYVPQRVKALLERRSGGMCEVCGQRRATQKIHARVAYRHGGHQEVKNLAHACGECHVMVDAGVFEFADFDAEGKPRWLAHPERFGFDRVPGFGQPRASSVREDSPRYDCRLRRKQLPVPFG